MKDHTVLLSSLKYIDEDVFAEIKNYTISSNDLYLTIAGTIGDVGLVPAELDGANLTENAAKLTDIKCSKQYLMYVLMSSIAQDHFCSRFHQVAQPKLSLETASSTLIPLPPYREQLRIAEELDRWLGVVVSVEDDLSELTNYVRKIKSKILDLAISGKLVPQDHDDEPAIELLRRINPAFHPCDNSHYENLPQGWVKAGFKDIYQTISSRDYQIQQRDIINEGLYPVVSQSSNYIEGYYNNKENLLVVTAPVLIFGDHTRVVKYIDFPFVIGADGVKVIKPLVNDKFAYYLLLYTSQHIENKGYSRHFQLIAKANYCIPPLREQTHIVKTIETLFETINTITAEL